MTPLCFIDTETTSLRRDRRVWEAAMIRRDEDGAKEATLIVLDVDLTEADPMSLRIGGFHHRHPRYGPRVLERREFDLDEHAAARFVEEWTRGAHLVGAVPHFDAEVLSDMLRRHGLCPAWHYHLIDVEAMAAGYLHGRVQEGIYGHTPAAMLSLPSLPWKSDELSRACGVDPPDEMERHTALGDARWALRWYDAITRGAQ